MSDHPCTCFVAQHPRAPDIDAALRAGDNPREVAARFNVGKSKVYEHRQHLGITERPARKAPGAPRAAASPEPPAATPVPPAEASPAKPSPKPVDNARGQVSTVDRKVSTESPPPSTDEPGPARVRPQVVEITARSYDAAVSTAIGVISDGRWRPAQVHDVAERHGISVDRARKAFQEAARHLRLNLGDYTERLAVSVSYTIQHRDECRARAESTRALADEWRAQEREALDAAKDATDIETAAVRLNEAARFGAVAAKYGLEAEKWAAQALAAQRHLDDIQCLKLQPAQITAMQVNLGGAGGGGKAEFEAFAQALALRFSDRPEILVALEEAAAQIEHSQPGDEAAIVTTGEAA